MKDTRVTKHYAWVPTRVFFKKDNEYGYIWFCHYYQKEAYVEKEYQYVDFTGFGSGFALSSPEPIMYHDWEIQLKYK